MLEQKDLEAIALLLDSKLEKSNTQMKVYIGEQFEQNNARMKDYIGEQFEQNNTRMKVYMGEQFEQNNTQMKSYISEQTMGSETFLLEEMERMFSSVNTKIEFMQKNIDELIQYYKITKLESDNTALLLQMITMLQKDVEELKKKTA